MTQGHLLVSDAKVKSRLSPGPQQLANFPSHFSFPPRALNAALPGSDDKSPAQLSLPATRSCCSAKRHTWHGSEGIIQGLSNFNHTSFLDALFSSQKTLQVHALQYFFNDPILKKKKKRIKAYTLTACGTNFVAQSLRTQIVMCLMFSVSVQDLCS